MKVTVSFDLDINETEWASTYPKDMADLPAAVTRYASNVVEDLFFDLGLANDSGRVSGKVDV